MTSPPADLRFRVAELDDADEVVAVVEAAYRGEPAEPSWTTEAELIGGQRVDRAMATETIADPDTSVVVAIDEADGRIVACCEVRVPDPSGNSVLGMFAVEPHRQGSGLGRAVLAAGEHSAVELGASAVELHVLDVRHELIAWYERRGYARTDDRVAFPYGDERFGIPKRDDLRFTVLRKSVDRATSRPPAWSATC